MTEQLPEELDVEYTPVLTALPYGWNALTYQEYAQRKAAQHEDAREIELRQLRAQLDAATKRAEQAEADARARGLTLATLCDMVLGENDTDRSDTALIRAVGNLIRERDAAHKSIIALEMSRLDLVKELDAKLHETQRTQAAMQEAKELRAQLDAANQKAHTLTLQLMRATGNADALRMAMRQEITEAEKRAEQAEADARYMVLHAISWDIPIQDYDKLKALTGKYFYK